MNILKKTTYYEILFDENKSVIMHKALPTTLTMSDEEFKQEMMLFVEMCEKYLPKRDLVHLVDMQYSIVPEAQEWVDINIFPRFVDIVKKMALVMPSSIFESIAVQQTLDEEVGQKFVKAYFDDENKALEWLMM